MTKNPNDLDAMARRYLDLWQEQWSSFATNPETAAQFGRMMEMMAPASGMMSRLFDPEGTSAGAAERSEAKKRPHGRAARRHYDEDEQGFDDELDEELDDADTEDGDDEVDSEFDGDENFDEESDQDEFANDDEDQYQTTSRSRARKGYQSRADRKRAEEINAQADQARAEATAAALQSVLGSVVDLARRVDSLGKRLESLEQRLPADGDAKPAPAKKSTGTVRRVAKRKSGTKAAAGKSKTTGSSSRTGSKRQTK